MDFQALIRAGVQYSNMDDDTVIIDIQDDVSGCKVLELKMSYEEFGKLISSNSNIKVQAKLYKECPIGKVREFKTILFDRPKYNVTREELEKIAAPHCVDGYKVNNWNDFTNHHRWTGKNQVEVVFYRFVDPK